MKKILIGFVIAVLAGFGGCVALLTYGKTSGEAAARQFFQKVEATELTAIPELLHPALKEAADPQLIAALVKEIPGRYGQFQSIDWNGMSFSDNVGPKGREQSYEGTMVFAKRPLKMKLSFQDGKLVGIHLTDLAVSKEVVAAIAVIPPDKVPYQKRAESFLQELINGDLGRAFGMMGEELQQKIGQDGFGKMAATLRKNGKVSKFEFVRSQPRAGRNDKLDVIFDCAFPSSKQKAHVSFQFLALRSGLMEFAIPSDLPGL
ncbi:MAG: hypothetical protein HY815_13810 [Candidatus Riflebacteria bacterium]|nr:hypothetical protein [Candidatus Riflebacteria bacterium]